MTGFEISKYSDETLLRVYSEVTQGLIQDTKDLLDEYDFKHDLEAELKKRGLTK